jgi:putative membrane protein
VSLSDLPAVNACFNGLSTVFLVLGYYSIRQQRKVAHRNCMIAATVSSAFFLAGYLTYHFVVKTVTPFQNPAWFRPFYLAILLSHILLAIVIVPLVISSLLLAAYKRFAQHRMIARWTWPLWMYVSVTGVLIYFLLYQVFPQQGH